MMLSSVFHKKSDKTAVSILFQSDINKLDINKLDANFIEKYSFWCYNERNRVISILMRRIPNVQKSKTICRTKRSDL